LSRASIFFASRVFTKADGLHRNSGLPEFRTINCRKSGKPDLRCHERVHARPPTLRPAMTAFGLAPMRRRGNDNTEKG
jgi:hypothetical protein